MHVKCILLFIWNSLAMSNIIDAYCTYRCTQEIKTHTEETREMSSKNAYINRKRYSLIYNINVIHQLRLLPDLLPETV